MMRRIAVLLLKTLLTASLMAAMLGWFVAPMFLHPFRRGLPSDLIRQADVTRSHFGARREDYESAAKGDPAASAGEIKQPSSP